MCSAARLLAAFQARSLAACVGRQPHVNQAGRHQCGMPHKPGFRRRCPPVMLKVSHLLKLNVSLLKSVLEGFFLEIRIGEPNSQVLKLGSQRELANNLQPISWCALSRSCQQLMSLWVLRSSAVIPAKSMTSRNIASRRRWARRVYSLALYLWWT